MGGACSTDEETRHHRENKKNRNNPTESYDTWQPKMLLDIGADPLAVVRDFPRMIVYVGTATHNYLPAGDGGAAAKTSGPSRRVSGNPLAPFSGTPHKPDSATAAGDEGTHLLHKTGSNAHQGRPPLATDAAKGNAAAATPAPSPQQPPRLSPGGGGGGRASQREPFREDDAFAARVKRVREEVMLLSELCDERGTFGAAFEAAWDRLVVQGTNDGGLESEAASEYLTPLQPPPQQQQQDGRPPASATLRRTHRRSLPLDVHQVLLNACVESGMIAMVEEQSHTAPASTTLRALGGAGSGGPPAPSRTSPAGASHPSRPESAVDSAIQLSEEAGLLSHNNPNNDVSAGYGAAETATSTQQEKKHKTKGKASRAQAKDGALKSSSTSQLRSAASLAGPGTSGAAAPPTASRYVVRSATFHLMQFATQGVMFFPVQRLKHVLWVPWSSHMQDVSWTIHISLQDATAADIIALKQRSLNALYNQASTVMTTEAGLGDGAQPKSTSAVLAASKSNTAVEERADAFGAMATTSALSETDLRATTASATVTAAAAANIEHRGKRKIIVIQHVQTGRHYVDAADRKTTPRYEMDWACSIRVDQETLQEAFAPFQRFAPMPSSTKASPLMGEEGAISTPPSQVRRAVISDDAFSNINANNVNSADPPMRGPVEDVALDGGWVLPSSAEGLPVAQLPGLLQREVVAAAVEVVAARVERPPHTMCMVSSTWKKRRDELDYVLEQQYDVHLEETDELHAKHLY